MSTEETTKKRKRTLAGQNSGGDMVYVLGSFGAVVYYFQHADTFGQYVLGLLKSLVWPAILVYQLLENFAK